MQSSNRDGILNGVLINDPSWLLKGNQQDMLFSPL